ncbi:hypothetical protein [Pseudomonas agarici]|uniref:hypothetical protein n=1 Tax=Pseudomonas agarici TaxID=46677 RepID=UPI0015A2B315|nr:hypothetical protein [Pseudomonas agarici]NWB91636.1 hypothetical protein [Pseudomonas agarici]
MDKKPSASPEPSPRKLSLADFIPEKSEISTSLGSLYIRTANRDDWKHFESDEPTELGRMALQRLVSREKNKQGIDTLSDEDFKKLTEADFFAINSMIAKKSDWSDLPAQPGLAELGVAVQIGKEKEALRSKKILDEMRKSIDTSYGFLGQTAVEKIQEQMSVLTNIRESLSASETLRATLSDINASSDLQRATDVLRAPFEDYTLDRSRSSDQVFVPQITPPEETVLGRATLESAENSRNTNVHINALLEIVSGLHQTILVEIIPGWIKKAEDDRVNAIESFDQARKSLNLTKWTIIISAVISLLATWWQISASQSIDTGNSTSQKITENLLREQLVVQQKLSEQQAKETAQVKQLLEKQVINAENLRTLIELNLSTPGHNWYQLTAPLSD